MSCQHEHFEASVQVVKVTEMDGDVEVTNYWAELTIQCRHCGQYFEFNGLPAGLDFRKPACSIDKIECRLPIQPSTLSPEEFPRKFDN